MESTHPIELGVTDDLRRSRLTVLFRILLAIPPVLWLALWGIAAFFVWILNWFATLFTGFSPDGFHAFLATFLRYSTHVYAYVYLLADPWPGFTPRDGYPVDLTIAPPVRQNRLVTFFRGILAIPAMILASVLGYVVQIIAFLAWFVCLALGRMPQGMENLGSYCLNYQQQTYGYLYLLTGRYPSLSWQAPGGAGSEPTELPPGEAQGALEPGPVRGDVEPPARS